MAETYVFGRSKSQLRHQAHGGALFKCGECGGDRFIIHHIHNPYGHDACERNAQCVACGTTWGGGYYTWKIVEPDCTCVKLAAWSHAATCPCHSEGHSV